MEDCKSSVLPNVINVVQKRIEVIRHEARDSATIENQRIFDSLTRIIPTNCEKVQENAMSLSDFVNGRMVELLHGLYNFRSKNLPLKSNKSPASNLVGAYHI